MATVEFNEFIIACRSLANQQDFKRDYYLKRVKETKAELICKSNNTVYIKTKAANDKQQIQQ